MLRLLEMFRAETSAAVARHSGWERSASTPSSTWCCAGSSGGRRSSTWWSIPTCRGLTVATTSATAYLALLGGAAA